MSSERSERHPRGHLLPPPARRLRDGEHAARINVKERTLTRTILAVLSAAVASLVFAPAAMATAQIDITCERVKIDYQQWPTGPPDVSHTVVRVDGAGP